MIKVKVPKTIKIGGFTYKITLDDERATKELDSDGAWGKLYADMRVIHISRAAEGEQFDNTFLHEIIHAINNIYCNKDMGEKLTTDIANGLHQVFEQLGIRFAR